MRMPPLNAPSGVVRLTVQRPVSRSVDCCVVSQALPTVGLSKVPFTDATFTPFAPSCKPLTTPGEPVWVTHQRSSPVWRASVASKVPLLLAAWPTADSGESRAVKATCSSTGLLVQATNGRSHAPHRSVLSHLKGCANEGYFSRVGMRCIGALCALAPATAVRCRTDATQPSFEVPHDVLARSHAAPVGI